MIIKRHTGGRRHTRQTNAAIYLLNAKRGGLLFTDHPRPCHVLNARYLLFHRYFFFVRFSTRNSNVTQRLNQNRKSVDSATFSSSLCIPVSLEKQMIRWPECCVEHRENDENFSARGSWLVCLRLSARQKRPRTIV